MKFDCGETWQEKLDRKSKWHRWFAWHPVRLAPHDCRWLEYVERKGVWVDFMKMSFWTWDYREIVKNKQFADAIRARGIK